jgi:hypothetical protein
MLHVEITIEDKGDMTRILFTCQPEPPGCSLVELGYAMMIEKAIDGTSPQELYPDPEALKNGLIQWAKDNDHQWLVELISGNSPEENVSLPKELEDFLKKLVGDET